MAQPWRFNERAHAGAEHLEPTLVAEYDEKLPFDPSAEIEGLRDLGLSTEDTVVDFGTGTGAFPLAVAGHCGRVVGVDVSEPMLEIARRKADAADHDNIEFVCEGILGYEHDGDPAAFAFSKNTLHHLPDFWKIEALKTIRACLESEGILRLRDLVYSFNPEESTAAIADWLDRMDDTQFTTDELHNHFRSEFSTYDFVMERLLTETGFELIDVEYREGFYASYTCRVTG